MRAQTAPRLEPDVRLAGGAREPLYRPARLVPESATIFAGDGFPLGATVYPSSGEVVLIVNAATGVPQGFYRGLAEYLAERGISVVTYDYRGIGRSRPPGRLADVRATMRDWARDAAAALDWTAARFPGLRIAALGHSFGGQCLALLPNARRLERAILVASQIGYWGHFARRDRPRAWFGVHVLIPGLARGLGYFPGSKVGLGEDLPQGVALEWARWCRSPNYLFDHLTDEERETFARFSAPVLAYKFTDDSFASGDSVERLLAQFPLSQPILRTVSPRDVAARRLGHFGLFRAAGRPLWVELYNWLSMPQPPRHERVWGGGK